MSLGKAQERWTEGRPLPPPPPPNLRPETPEGGRSAQTFPQYLLERMDFSEEVEAGGSSGETLRVETWALEPGTFSARALPRLTLRVSWEVNKWPRGPVWPPQAQS